MDLEEKKVTSKPKLEQTSSLEVKKEEEVRRIFPLVDERSHRAAKKKRRPNRLFRRSKKAFILV